MRDILYDGKHEVNIEEVLEKINHYIELAERGQSIYKEDKRKAFDIARAIRQSMAIEYKNHNLKKIEDLYEENNSFNDYSGAVHDVVASITGRLTHDNLYSFLYDVVDYMRYVDNSLQGRLKADANK